MNAIAANAVHNGRRLPKAREPMNIGERIQKRRLESGLSLTNLSRQSGVSRGYLHLLEKGENNPTLDVLEKIAAAFEISLTELIALYDIDRVGNLTKEEYRLLSKYRRGDISGLLRMIADRAEIEPEADVPFVLLASESETQS